MTESLTLHNEEIKPDGFLPSVVLLPDPNFIPHKSSTTCYFSPETSMHTRLHQTALDPSDSVIYFEEPRDSNLFVHVNPSFLELSTPQQQYLRSQVRRTVEINNLSASLIFHSEVPEQQHASIAKIFDFEQTCS